MLEIYNYMIYVPQFAVLDVIYETLHAKSKIISNFSSLMYAQVKYVETQHGI